MECPDLVPNRSRGINTINYFDETGLVNRRPVGTVAVHTCLSGYLPNGDLNQTCMAFVNESRADWTLPEVSCQCE